MPVWYEVEKSEDGIINFMECNWHFHDFLIGQASYFPAKQMVELLMKYDTPNDIIILRFLKVKDFHFQSFDNPCDSMIFGSILKLSEDGCFLWYSSDDCPENDEELKNNSTWVEAENIIWAITDENGNPRELPEDKINQVWNNYGNTEYKHFQLKEYTGDKEAAM